MKKKTSSKKEIVKETRDLKVMFAKSGNGYMNTRMTFPLAWFQHMGINPDDRDTEVTYSPRTKKITIRKKSENCGETEE